MNTDARISTELPTHPKTTKLKRRLGGNGCWSLVCLFLWVSANKPSGDLSGMSDEDIEISAKWEGEFGAFVKACVDVRFLDGEEGFRKIHDWKDHNPWAAGFDERSLKGKWNSIKRHHGIAEADRQVPEYAAIRNGLAQDKDADSKLAEGNVNAASLLSAMLENGHSNAPTPSPTPLPKELPTTSGESPPIDGLKIDPDPIFGHGLAFLMAKSVPERGARSFLGSMRKQLGEMLAAELLAIAEQQDVSDPIPWLRKAAESRQQNGARASPASDLKPRANDNFQGKSYVGTPIDQLPTELRDSAAA